MRTYEELVQEFTKQEDKKKWINELHIEELKVLLNGLPKNIPIFKSLWNSWIEYMGMIILRKIELERENKLKDLGI